MNYSISQIATIKSKIFAKITLEFENIDTEEDLHYLINKYGIHFEDEPAYVNTHQMKILVYGSLAGNVNEYKMVARKLGINEDRIVFENDYTKLTNYDVARLRNSTQYSDIIIGPNPHSQKGIDGYSSFAAMVRENPSEFPRCIEAKSNNKFKITKSNFRESLLETRYIEALNE